MNTEHDPIRQEAMKTDQSNGWGADFSGNDTYPPFPWGKVLSGAAVALAFLVLACAMSSVGMNA